MSGGTFPMAGWTRDAVRWRGGGPSRR